MSQPRVAVLMKSYLGDAVMAEPLLSGLKAQGVELFVNTSPAAKDVLAHVPMDAFHPMVGKRSTATMMEDVRALRAFRPDIAILVNRSFRSALAARLAGVRIRVGHSRDWRNRLLTKVLPYREDQYEAESYCELARAAGFSLGKPEPRLVAPEFGGDLPRRPFGIQPAARYVAKELTAESVSDLLRRAEAAGYAPILFGGPEERERCEAVATPGCTILAGRCSIPQTLAALGRMEFFVSADTGLAHLAYGVRTPSLVVFGPNPASKWAHGAPQKAIEAPEIVGMAGVDGEALWAAVQPRLSVSSR